MRHRAASYNHFLVRLFLCLLVLAQSSIASAAPASQPNRVDGGAPAVFNSANSTASASRASTVTPSQARADSCAPSTCTIYLPWLLAAVSPATAPTAQPTSTAMPTTTA